MTTRMKMFLIYVQEHTRTSDMYLNILACFLSRYMVDAADHEKLEASRNELHGLLEKPQLAGIPVSNLPKTLMMFSKIVTLNS